MRWVRPAIGVLLLVAAAACLAGPVQSVLGFGKALESGAAFGFAYQITLGLLLAVGGLYALTRRPGRGPRQGGEP
jgi:hypothetical protein